MEFEQQFPLEFGAEAEWEITVVAENGDETLELTGIANVERK